MPVPVIIDLPGPIASVDVAPAPAAPQAPPPVDHSLTVRQAQARLDQERESVALARTAMQSAAQKIAALDARITAAAEAQLVDLALAIAEKVLAQEIDQGRARIEPLVREALRHLPARRDIIVRLNPQDLAYVQAAASGAAQGATGGLPAGASSASVAPDAAAPAFNGLKTVADPTLRRGECTVESAEGAVSATLADRLKAAADVLKGGAQ
jgi:flagellar assembly protein FliH